MEAAALPVEGRAGSGARRAPPSAERYQASALEVLAAVTSYLDSGEELPGFFGRLAAAVAGQCGARRAAFWRVGPRNVLTLQPNPHGFADDSRVYGLMVQLGAGDGVMERVILGHEPALASGTSNALDDFWHRAQLAEVTTSIAAAWRAGEHRIGAVAAYDSERGFTSQDLWVLQLAGVAAGLLWQYKESVDSLGRTAALLEEAMAARRQLLNNIAAGGDEARRRFASALHDDSLQLLTAAELQLERLRTDSGGNHHVAQLDQLHGTLCKVEDSLRRLLIDVSPEPLQLPSDLSGAISERLESLRIRSGIETLIDTKLPNDIPQTIQTIVMKSIAEALNNVEKHARATRVTVAGEIVDGGVRVEITDDGTGFVVAEARVPGHIGLVALRERAQLAGGWCHVESDPGTGTRIEFWIPLSL